MLKSRRPEKPTRQVLVELNSQQYLLLEMLQGTYAGKSDGEILRAVIEKAIKERLH